MSNKARMGQTIIEGGHIRTSLIEAEKLAAELMSVDQITVNTSLKSANYKEGETGFMIDGKTGDFELNKGLLRGDVIFGGSIASGPLYLDEENPTNLSSQIVFKEGESSERFHSILKVASYTDLYNGALYKNNILKFSFSHISWGYSSSFEIHYTFYDKKFNELEQFEIARTNYSDSHYDLSVREYYKLPYKIVLNLYNPIGKTLKLIDLPTSAASQHGYVYQDSEGYLRIS